MSLKQKTEVKKQAEIEKEFNKKAAVPKVDKASIVDKALSQGITCSFCGGNLSESGVKSLTESDKKFKDKPTFILECRNPHTKHDVLQKVVQEASTPSGIIEILVKDL